MPDTQRLGPSPAESGGEAAVGTAAGGDDGASGGGARSPSGRLRRAVQAGFFAVEGLFDRAFGPSLNPFYQLGAMSFFFYWIVAATGIYLYIGFETSVTGAYESVEALTRQWYLGGVVRSLHRYSSDAMVVTVLLHLTREFAFDRMRGARWFSWLTGVPILWLLFSAGIGGYWLVWDKLAQYVAVVTSEWVDWLPIFSESVARNFLTAGSLSDRFFTLLVLFHIAVPLFLLFAMWIHLLRLTRPRVNPPRALAAGTMVMLVALSLVKPAVSQGPADLATVAAVVDLDWFYLGLYPLLDALPAGAVWGLAVGLTVLLMVLPWLPRRPGPVAVVDLSLCNGCGRCFDDCPFEAVAMEPRSDGRPYLREAVVDPDLCVGCGICVGACPTATPFRKADELATAIDLPDLPLVEIRRRVHAAVGRLSAARERGEATVLVFGCDHGPSVAACEGPAVASCSLPCTAMLPPSFIDYIISRGGADGVMVTGCREDACFHRFGARWTVQRIAGERDPYLRQRVPRKRVAQFWAAASRTGALVRAVEDFRRRLETLGAGKPRAARRRGAARRGGGREGAEARL